MGLLLKTVSQVGGAHEMDLARIFEPHHHTVIDFGHLEVCALHGCEVINGGGSGLSFLGLVFVIALGVGVVAVGAQSVPVFLEYQAIVKAANKAAREGKREAPIGSAS